MRYIFGFIIFLLLIVLGLIFIFSGNKKSGKPTSSAPIVMSLPNYATTDAAVSMTVDGHINGDDAHRAIRVSVNRNSRTLDIIQGYSGNIIDSHTFPNTGDAYDIFLRALNNEAFLTKQKKTTAPNDYRGQCPDGTRTIFNLTQGTNQLSNLWLSSCDTGNFGGASDVINELFRAQITDYDNLTSAVEL